jgi:hypothetical protein
MISLDVIKESLERDNLLSCEAIILACNGFKYLPEYWTLLDLRELKCYLVGVAVSYGTAT